MVSFGSRSSRTLAWLEAHGYPRRALNELRVEQLGTDTSWPGWPADAWILQLTLPERATWRTTVRRAVTWVRTVLDRLFGRSSR